MVTLKKTEQDLDFQSNNELELEQYDSRLQAFKNFLADRKEDVILVASHSTFINHILNKGYF